MTGHPNSLTRISHLLFLDLVSFEQRRNLYMKHIHTICVMVAEWLRRLTAKPRPSGRVGSNPTLGPNFLTFFICRS